MSIGFLKTSSDLYTMETKDRYQLVMDMPVLGTYEFEDSWISKSDKELEDQFGNRYKILEVEYDYREVIILDRLIPSDESHVYSKKFSRVTLNKPLIGNQVKVVFDAEV